MNNTINKFTGTGVALVTPFLEDTSIDFKGIESLVEHVIAGGVDYLVVLGTTGEAATCTLDERKRILEKVSEVNNSRKPIVLGIGGNNTAEVLQLFDEFDFSKVDGILSASPYYNKPSQEGIYRHYTAIADKSPKPVILYNVPGRTSSNVTAETTLRLAEHSNIIGIKEASGDLEQCMKIARSASDNFLLISGDDLLTTSMISFGAKGVISVLANAFTKDFTSMITHALKGDFVASSKYLYNFIDINNLMYVESNPVGVKTALEILGITGRQVRLPLVKGSDKLINDIKNLMK